MTTFTDRDLQKIIAYLDIADTLGNLSRDERLKVGCVLIKEGRIISTGFNGTASGLPNINHSIEYVGEPDHEIPIKKTKEETIHAEQNSIIFAARHGVATKGASAFVTHEPCRKCSATFIQAGIEKVFFNRAYESVTSTSGVELLKAAGISVFKLIEVNCALDLIEL